jgi:drug/metabolite transporter (DMT)-like permease
MGAPPMPFTPRLLIPLGCALGYVLAALIIKRAAAFGVGVWRTSFLSNWAIALLFVPVWFGAGGQIHPLTDYGRPAIVALLFFGGQALIFLALERGDVSVTTPVMGTKVILVALGSSLLHVGEVSLAWWIGAALSTTAIALLHLGEGSRHRRVGVTVLLTLGSALLFSLSDVFMQKWVPAWGLGNFLPPVFLLVGLLSCAFMPFFHAPLTALSAAAWRWAAPGALLMALTNAGVVLAIVLVGSATVVNIIFSARGLFSVLLVWLVGHWFTNDEHRLGGRVLALRLGGAALMLAAIVLVLV